MILWIAHNSKKVRLHPSSDVEKYMKNLEKKIFEVEHRPRLLMKPLFDLIAKGKLDTSGADTDGFQL